MSSYLYKIAQFAFRRRRVVLAVWLAAAIAAIAIAQASGGKTNDNFTIPGTESQNASNVLTEKLPAFSGGQTTVVFATANGSGKITDPADKAAIDSALTNLKSVPQVSNVVDPFTGQLVSKDGKVGLGQVQWSAKAVDVKDSGLDALQAAMKPVQAAGVQVEYNGSVFPGWNQQPSELPELIGLVVAFFILMITFGAFAAAGMPILGAIIGVITTLMGITALASVLTIASASTTVAIMLGLSCGIDYGLFILSRHRANLLNGMTPAESVPRAMGTAGSSVVFAALTVIIALCGLSVVGIPFLTVMGLAAAVAVLMALLIALPLLIGGVVLLGVLALPATKMQLGLPGGSSKPKSDTSRKAYDLTTAGFGAGFNGALLVVANNVNSQAQVTPMVTALSKVNNVVQVSPLARANGIAVIRVIPRTGPDVKATATLVHHIRDERASIEGTTGAHILIGGTTASNIDVSSKLSSALPVFLIVVVGLAFILLTFAFRTILVPIKSIIGFLLSVVAAFGAQVAIFQWGWGKSLFNITPTETISFLPIIMLAIIFGLSSDYEVFVVSRIKEDFTKTGDARGAVERGTGLSARVVTAAALIMFSIFVAFMVSKDPTIRAIGFSFAVGVFLDAFVVRLTLVPAVMAIVRSKLWYHPQWFAKYVPDPDIEGERLEHQLAAARETATASSA